MKSNIALSYKAFFLAVIVIVSGCGRQSSFDGFEKYVSSFEAESKLRGINIDASKRSLKIEFANMASNHRAICHSGFLENPTITVNPSNWSNQNESGKKWIMFHELGHCLLGKGHNSDLSSDGEPVSIMHPSLFNWAHFELNSKEYFDQLFL